MESNLQKAVLSHAVSFELVLATRDQVWQSSLNDNQPWWWLYSQPRLRAYNGLSKELIALLFSQF